MGMLTTPQGADFVVKEVPRGRARGGHRPRGGRVARHGLQVREDGGPLAGSSQGEEAEALEDGQVGPARRPVASRCEWCSYHRATSVRSELHVNTYRSRGLEAVFDIEPDRPRLLLKGLHANFQTSSFDTEFRYHASISRPEVIKRTSSQFRLKVTEIKSMTLLKILYL